MISDVDPAAAHQPAFLLTVRTTAGQEVRVHLQAPDADTARRKALQPAYQPRGLTICEVLTVTPVP